MSGELWLGKVQFGKEAIAGTGVPATRRMYFETPTLSKQVDARLHTFATGTRDNQRSVTTGPTKAGGSLDCPMSADEIIELLLMTINGGVVPTQPDAVNSPTVYQWLFKPGLTTDTVTIEQDDGAIQRRGLGMRGNKLQITGTVAKDNMVKVDLFGLDLEAHALTGALAERVPSVIEGWESKLFIDALGGTPGGTNIPGTLIGWDLSVDNQLAYKYTGDNTRAANKTSIGALKIQAKITFEAAAAAAATEFANFGAGTPRLVRLEFGNNENIEDTYNKLVDVDLPGVWTAVDLTGNGDGTRTYQFTADYMYDPTNGFGVQIMAQNARATAY